jgi:CBS domain-containing protein
MIQHPASVPTRKRSKRPSVLFVVDEQKRLCGRPTSPGVMEGALDADKERTSAGDIARPSQTVVLPHASLDRALKLMSAHDEDYLPVVDDTEQRRVVGVLHHRACYWRITRPYWKRVPRSGGRLNFSSKSAQPCNIAILPHSSLDRALQLMSVHDEDFLPVVDDTAERSILGIIYHKDLVLAQNRVLFEARAEGQGEN